MTVPANFFGMHADHQLTMGTFDCDFVRSWGYSGSGASPGIQVATVNPSSGVFSWTTFDELFTNNTGKSFFIELGIPADWMITRAAVGGALFGTKGNMVPTGTTEMNNYLGAVTAMVNRAITTYGKTGLVWELWNEFDLTGEVAAAELAALPALAKEVNQAIKAIDPTAIILAPSVSSPTQKATLQTFLGASDGAGGRGGDWVDGVSVHFYDTYMKDYGFDYLNTINDMKLAMSANGYSLPIYVGETGFYASSLESNNIKRRMLAFAAFGVKCFAAYSRDFILNPMDPFVGEYNAMASLLRGASVSNLLAYPDGSVSGEVNGSFVRY